MRKPNKRQMKFIDEYFHDFNASGAYVRAGYSPNGARQSAYNLLTKPYIKAEIERRYEKERNLSIPGLISRLEAMTDGEIPTKVVRVPNDNAKDRFEYDRLGALERLGKVHAMFIDKVQTEEIGLEIVDDETSDNPDSPSA